MEITITKEEAILILTMLKHSWVPIDMQLAVVKLVDRIERELGEAN